MKIPISEIKTGERFRKDLGDIMPLVESIKRHGLLHPIVLTEDKELVCGRRRIGAYQKLNLLEIEANLVSLANSSSPEAEADENIVRKNFTVNEIAEIDQFYREKEEAAAIIRQKKGSPSENFAKGRSSAKIAERVGISDRQLEKIRTIRLAGSEDPFPAKIWDKVASGKMKVDKGYHQVKRFQRIKEAEELASSSNLILEKNSRFDLQLGPMQEKGSEIADNSIDMIFTDPPYTEEALTLYADLAKLADRVLKPGGSLVTVVGHYALFKINDLIQSNSDFVYHWQIVVKHGGSITRLHAKRVWAYYKPLLWYYKSIVGSKDHGPTMYHDVADFIESEPVIKNNHEWEQSTVEAMHMIEPLTVRGNVILDPFAGSGTTGVAALELKRKFIGIECDKVHHSRALRRLNKLSKELENTTNYGHCINEVLLG